MKLTRFLVLAFFAVSQGFAQQWMIAQPKVTLYKTAAASGASVGKLSIGTPVKMVEKSKNGQFLKVSQEKGLTGWIAANQAFSTDHLPLKDAVFAVVRNYIKTPNEGGAENAEVEKWVKNLKSDKRMTTLELAELEFYRLLTIQRICRSIQPESPEWKNWLSSHNDLIYNTDFGNAGYFLKAEYLWKLEGTLAATEPLKERIAFEAGTIETGGECEGYWVCVLERAMSKAGEYLKRHPKGKNAPLIVKNLQEELQNMDPAEVKTLDATDQKLTKKLAIEWKSVLSKVTDSQSKKQLITLFNKI